MVQNKMRQLTILWTLLLALQLGLCVDHQIWFGKAGKPVTTTTATITSGSSTPFDTMRSGLASQFSSPSASMICVSGMWALYSAINWGEENEAFANVITVAGYGRESCATYATYPALRNVASVLYLGNKDLSVPGVTIFSQPNFLGSYVLLDTTTTTTATKPFITAVGTLGSISGIPLGSIAITGTTGLWRLCSDSICMDAVCVDMSLQPNGIYLNPNVPADKTTNWPVYVRAHALATSSAVCRNDDNPQPVGIQSPVQPPRPPGGGTAIVIPKLPRG